ncbi:MAG: hypothetical protein ACFFCH_04845 [Promethearchaeota archaeon]
MKKTTTLILILVLLSTLILSPIIAPAVSLQFGGFGTNNLLQSKSPPVPQTTADWLDVNLDVEFSFDENSVTIGWTGRPRTGAQSPFNPLYTWTKSGYIDGGIWEGNPGNATIYAVAWDNTTTASEVRDFLNTTMENYIRYTSYPSLSIFNFTDYENQTMWLFNDAIASHEEFLNNTFYLVNNATAYLMDGFNATGIIGSLSEYHIHLEWFESAPVADVTFTYTISDIITQQGDTYEFRLGDALGQSALLNLTGEGTVIINGPYNRVYVNGTPAWIFEDKTFPFYPISSEEYPLSDSTKDFEYWISYQEASSVLSISREFSTNAVNRGDLLTVNIFVENTGNTIFTQAVIRDVIPIENGVFQLVEGIASITIQHLQPGENITLEYTVMALQTGIYEYPAVVAIGIDLFNSQYAFTSTTESITIGGGLIPSELTLIGIAVVIIVIFIVLLILYRFRRRIF